MMLRSSSTPVLGSLLSSYSETPPKHSTPHNHCIKLSSNSNGGFHNIAKSVTNSPSVSDNKSRFRRVQSDGNLEGLVNPSHTNADEFTFSDLKVAQKPMLEAIPSFSSGEGYDSDEGVEGNSDRLVNRNLISQEVGRSVNGYGDVGFFRGEGKMYLAVPATGFPDGGGYGGGGGSCRPVDFGRDGGGLSMEEHYKNMLEQSPGNSLFLRNYAHFLYQEKGDLEGAEEYYSRAILADPKDGEVICEYAKLIWEFHHDKQRAAAYFERAVQASSQDSHVHASYASFLWDTEDDDEDEKENSGLFDHEINGFCNPLSVVL
ncbi:hypothetical protein ACS0TY_005644 [Phlomoides rotata]